MKRCKSEVLSEGNLLLVRFLHLGVRGFHAVRRFGWFPSRTPKPGVHAIPLTSDGRIVLVTLSYAKGWRLPGGGLRDREDMQKAVLRELGEEIGLTGYASIERVGGFQGWPEHGKGQGSLFIVRGIQYRPRWSLEVKEIGEFDLENLPMGTASITHEFLAAARHHLS